MPIIDESLSSLQQIRNQVRILTRSLNTSQLSDQSIDNYINEFLLYDFPEILRSQYFHSTFTFYTEPFVDTYENITDNALSSNPLYNFINKYTSFNPPLYIAGIQSDWEQSMTKFYQIYPPIKSINSIGVNGDGATTAFQGNVSVNFDGPNSNTIGLILPGSVLFESMNSSGVGISLVDYKVPGTNTVGALGPVGQPVNTLPSPYGQINYITGEFNLNFAGVGIPAAGVPINSQLILVQPSKPLSVLYYDNKFVVRPVPDQVYQITMQAYVRPIELLSLNQMPKVGQMARFISYGATKKIFEDRMDTDSLQKILPAYLQYRDQVERPTIMQLNNQRSPTMFVNQLQDGGMNNGASSGFNGFYQ
jgi:hypothetical protein